MGELFPKAEVDDEAVRAVVSSLFGFKISKRLKTSQNVTYQAVCHDGKNRACVRVTPDPEGIHGSRIAAELLLLDSLGASGLEHVCLPIHGTHLDDSAPHGATVDKRHRSLVRARVGSGAARGEKQPQQQRQQQEQQQQEQRRGEEGWCWVVAFHYALGQPVNTAQWAEWLSDRKIATWCGRFLAEMHVISRGFAESDVGKAALAAGNFRRFDSDQLHSGVMAGYTTGDEADAALCEAGCGPEFGIVHGDLNVSNFFYRGPELGLSVFDFDQVQLSWFEYDLVAPIQTAVMLAMAGAPVDGEFVPGLPDPNDYKEWVIEGYESVAGKGSVNRARLDRMIEMRYEFYRRFCKRATDETPDDHEMIPFCRYVNGWIYRLDTHKAAKEREEEAMHNPAMDFEDKEIAEALERKGSL